MIYDAVTGEPYAPSELEEAEQALRSSRRWLANAVTAPEQERAERLIVQWTAEVARLKSAGEPEASMECGEGSPDSVSRAATGQSASPANPFGVEQAAGSPGAGASSRPLSTRNQGGHRA